MRKIIKAVLSATFYILMLVVIPNIGLQYVSQLVPEEILQYMGEIINLQGIVMATSVIGVARAVLAFCSNMMDDWSPIKLLLSIASDAVSFYLFLLLIGLGNPLHMGLTQLSIEIVTIVWDFRFFISLELLLLGINILIAIIRFYFARKEYLAGR